MGATKAIAEFATSAEFDASARSFATAHFVDTIGVMLAATAEPEAAVLNAWARQHAAPGTSGVVGVWRQAQPSVAAFVNGAYAHLLDYDDVSTVVKGHPSAVLVPAILAAGTVVGATGASALDAYLVGLGVAEAVAAGFDVEDHYARGWHATSTIGVVAATAAVSRLVGSSVDQLRTAVGMAASFSSGSRANFGSLTKALHVGRAAETAVMSALLARSGGTANVDQLEACYGFFELFGPARDDAAIERCLSRPSLLRDSLTVKRYPCCFHAHRAVDAAVALHPTVDISDVESVDVTVHPGGASALVHPRPVTGMQAKFSGQYCVATALMTGELGLTDFSDESVARPEIRELSERISVSECQRPPVGTEEWSDGFAVVQVRLRRGEVRSERVDVPSGNPRRPVSDHARRVKFRQCLEYASLGERGDLLLSAIENLAESEHASDVLDAICSPGRADPRMATQ